MMNTENAKTGCLICGEDIIYLEKAELMKCAVCGKEEKSTAVCRNGHYICDACHADAAYARIKYVCLNTDSKNPVEILEEIAASPSVHTHGPEYHVIVAASLLTAYHNAGGDIDLQAALDAAEMRGKKIPGGFCGLAGSCGAGLSAGIFLSAALKTTPLSKENWGLGMQLTSECLAEIGKTGGPRCCRRDSCASIKTAVRFVNERLGVCMELPEKIICSHSDENRECLKEKCPYFPRK